MTVAVELGLTVGYVGFATILRHKLKFNPRRIRLADVVVILTFVPAGTTLTSLSYCGVLYLGGALPAGQFYAAMRHFWISDTIGLITIIPAATSVFACLSQTRWRWSAHSLVTWSVFILGACLGFAVLFGVGDAREYQMFYLLFLPIIWLGMRVGYRRRGCAASHPTGASRNDHTPWVRGQGFHRFPNAHAGAFDHGAAARRPARPPHNAEGSPCKAASATWRV
jgi:hypothetical protein